jgi:hypothetical protein
MNNPTRSVVCGLLNGSTVSVAVGPSHNSEDPSVATNTYDAIVIGTGEAGPFAASRFARAGMTAAIVERGKCGGTCVNTGCIPTKQFASQKTRARVRALSRRRRTEITSSTRRHEANEDARRRSRRHTVQTSLPRPELSRYDLMNVNRLEHSTLGLSAGRTPAPGRRHGGREVDGITSTLIVHGRAGDPADLTSADRAKRGATSTSASRSVFSSCVFRSLRASVSNPLPSSPSDGVPTATLYSRSVIVETLRSAPQIG